MEFPSDYKYGCAFCNYTGYWIGGDWLRGRMEDEDAEELLSRCGLDRDSITSINKVCEYYPDFNSSSKYPCFVCNKNDPTKLTSWSKFWQGEE